MSKFLVSFRDDHEPCVVNSSGEPFVVDGVLYIGKSNNEGADDIEDAVFPAGEWVACIRASNDAIKEAVDTTALYTEQQVSEAFIRWFGQKVYGCLSGRDAWADLKAELTGLEDA